MIPRDYNYLAALKQAEEDDIKNIESLHMYAKGYEACYNANLDEIVDNLIFKIDQHITMMPLFSDEDIERHDYYKKFLKKLKKFKKDLDC